MFLTNTIVRFADVDPAGIVFYPRYFEMLNGAVEDWFADMGTDFRSLHIDQKIGTPTVQMECQFVSPSELGDCLSIEINPLTVGRSSCTFAFRFFGDGRDRLAGNATIVFMDLVTRKSAPWPRALHEQFINAGAAPKQ